MPRKKSQSSSGKGRRVLIPDFTVREWNGTNTLVKDTKDLLDGETGDSLNWITGQFKDHIELRRGSIQLGTNQITGAGRVTGLGIGTLRNGTQIPFFTYGQKIMYYDVVSNTNLESTTTNILGSAANGEDVSVMPYQNLTGSYVYFTSPNSSIFKVAVANPASVLDLNSRAFRGQAKIDTNRMFMWQRKDQAGIIYNSTLYCGVSDQTDISAYTQKTAQNVGTGDGSTKTFVLALTADTVSNNVKDTIFGIEVAAPIAAGQSVTGISKASRAVVTMASTAGFSIGTPVIIQGAGGMVEINGVIGIVMVVIPNVSITISINSSTFTTYTSGGTAYPCEYFVDDQNGNLTSSLGGTGTINYVTGAGTVTFNTAPTNTSTIEAQFYEENSSSGGVTDFTIDASTAGKGKEFPQYDGGGMIQAVWPFDSVQYCFHIIKTWYVNLTNTDTNATNLPYRSNFGIPYGRAAYPTPDGILVLDNSHPVNPKIRFLEISPSVAALITIVPISISDKLDLSQYGFNKCVTWRWGDYDIVSFQNVTNGVIDSVNTRTFIRNIYSSQWDLLDYSISCLAEYNGMLIAGDSLSNNVYILFSGFDDSNSLINNHWTSKPYLFAEGVKKCNRFVIKGLIQQTQNIDIGFSTDFGNFVKLFTVQGNASYVNIGSPTVVGSNTVGSQVVGGGNGVGAPIIAYPYEVEFIIGTDLFEYLQVQFSANNIGYASIDEFTFKDIRWKGRKSSPIRTIAN